MQNTGQNYADAFNYEIFVRRAFKCDRSKHHADVGYLKVLLDHERGHWDLKPKAFDKQFKEVKNAMYKAIQKFKKLKLTGEESAELYSTGGAGAKRLHGRRNIQLCSTGFRNNQTVYLISEESIKDCAIKHSRNGGSLNRTSATSALDTSGFFRSYINGSQSFSRRATLSLQNVQHRSS